MNTQSFKKSDIPETWVLLDAKDKTLGRFAAQIAKILSGKNKPEYTPYQDCGDNLIIINSDHVHLTGNKAKDKIYYHHTGYPGGIKETNPEKMKVKNKSNDIIKLAIKRMIPSGPLGRKQLSNCKIFSGEQHSHEAQQPKIIEFQKLNQKNLKR